jgi:hypothetical protein
MINNARQVPSSDSESAVASDVKLQLMFITGVFVLILTVPLPENFPCSERRKAASSACAPVEQKRQAAASKAAVDFIKTFPLAIMHLPTEGVDLTGAHAPGSAVAMTVF